jgi:hypothetical protein
MSAAANQEAEGASRLPAIRLQSVWCKIGATRGRRAPSSVMDEEVEVTVHDTEETGARPAMWRYLVSY